jgi:hypothetical protein
MIAAAFCSTQSVSASSCPKEYVKRHFDERNVKTGDYWITNVRIYSRLWEIDVKETYTRISKQRPPDFSCTFQNVSTDSDAYHYGFRKGSCKNRADISWDPFDREQEAYSIDISGSHSLSLVGPGFMSIVDKEGKRFYSRIDIARSTSWLTSRGAYSAPYHIVRDTSEHMLVEAIALRELFTAGNQEYVAIGREIETGFYCSYQGGVSPSF